MPILHLTHVPPALMARLRSGARAKDQPLDAYQLADHGCEVPQEPS